MTTPPASNFLNTVALLRAGKISVDDARARNREQRQALGEDGYDRAKREAMVADYRRNA